MKRKRNLFQKLFTLVAFFIFGATGVNAETVRDITDLADFKSVIESTNSFDKLRLTQDINANEDKLEGSQVSSNIEWRIDKDYVLDLNGHKITSDAYRMFELIYSNDCTLTIADSSESGTGSIIHNTDTDSRYAIYIKGNSSKVFKLIIDGIDIKDTYAYNSKSIYAENHTETLIVKNTNIFSGDFSGGFGKYEFTNVVVKPSKVGVRASLVTGAGSTTVQDVLGANQELYYHKYSFVGAGSQDFGNIKADLTSLINDVWTYNLENTNDNAIVVKYKDGFKVSNVTLNETFNYTPSSKTITIENMGTSNLQIDNVSVSDSNFKVNSGNKTDLAAGEKDNSWTIEAKKGLRAGTYTAIITVTDSNGNTYSSTVTLVVGPREITNIANKIMNVNDEITYGDSYEPKLDGLASDIYEITYYKKVGSTYQEVSAKPTDVGEYKILFKIVNPDYSGTDTEKEYKIIAKNITGIVDALDIPDLTYNGEYQTPDVTVKYGDITLLLNKDYTVEYSSHLGASDQATATIKPVEGSNYTFDEFNEFFKIKKYEIKDTDVFLDYTSVVADGNQKKPGVTVKMGNNVIGANEYNVSYGVNIYVGEGTVTVEIKSDSDNYEGTVTKTFQIVNKQELIISGIESQEVIYTGYDVQLSGTLTVSNNIPVSSITVTWYKDGVELSSVPKNAGVYKVVYSYEDSTYIGRKEITVTVKKKTSTVPTPNSYKGIVNDKLSSITLPNGFKWANGNETILAGNNTYTAKYTTNNDTTNYTTESISISVYGKSKVDLNTTVNGTGGTISSSKLNVLESTTETIIFTPNTGYEIDTVTVNGVDKTSSLVNNKLDIVIGTNDINVEVKFKPIKFTITVNDVENVMISPVGVSTVNYNDSKDIIVIPDIGYNLVSVKVNGVEKVTEISNDKLTLSNITEDINIVIIVERNIYNVIEGGNQKYTISKDTDATFRIDADYSMFIDGGKVYVDGELVDSKNYTSKSGSTIITLKKDFISTLSVGEHSLKVLFGDGEANTMFTVVKLDNASTGTNDVNKESSPKTGDSIGFYITAGILSISLFTGLCVYKRKENN